VQAILDKARTAERQTLAASRALQEEQARRKRAADAWHNLVSFRDDRIPAGLTGPALRQRDAQLIVGLGYVLRIDGWQALVDAVCPGDDAKSYALLEAKTATDFRVRLPGRRASSLLRDDSDRRARRVESSFFFR
jgi:hypothetical protein